MGQAVADLPDPLESSTPAEAKSADDLLSQLAGSEIDRLLAESEGDDLPVSAHTEPPVVANPAIAETAAPQVAAVDLDAVLETAVADHAAERSALRDVPQAVVTPPVDHSPRIDLGSGPRRVPLILRPLEWLSSPLDPWPDQLREILGKVGLMTLINALAVLAYVLLVRKHHH